MRGLVARMLALVVASFALAACGGEQAAPGSSTAEVTTVTEQSHEGSDAAIAVCRQVITSAGVMVRDYNAFITRLNQTQNYARIDKEDRYARETLNTGADLVREALSPEVPQDLEQKVQEFLTTTEQLSEQIGARRKLALNKAMDNWSDARTELIDSCGEFMPTGTN